MIVKRYSDVKIEEYLIFSSLTCQKVDELYDLLSNHYVEDDDAMFRFNYSSSFLNWSVLAC